VVEFLPEVPSCVVPSIGGASSITRCHISVDDSEGGGNDRQPDAVFRIRRNYLHHSAWLSSKCPDELIGWLTDRFRDTAEFLRCHET
jgi:hypothetical protein